MTAASIPAARGGDYARYLEGKTIAPERGDYYLTPDGEMTQAAGRWLTDPETLERLGVRPDGPADGENFVSLMEGHHPQTGRWLRRAGADGSRGGGIDSVFSAPKPVSVAWALADPWQREQIENAHANAVEQTVEYMREHVPVVRRRYGGEVVEEPAKDLIAVEYRHTTARGVSGASAASCETSRSRTAAPSSSPHAQTSRTPGERSRADTTSVPTRRCGSSPPIVHPTRFARWRTGSRSG